MGLERIANKLLGKEMAVRLRIVKPKGISKDNMVVYSYLDSVDGAIRRGELVIEEELEEVEAEQVQDKIDNETPD